MTGNPGDLCDDMWQPTFLYLSGSSWTIRLTWDSRMVSCARESWIWSFTCCQSQGSPHTGQLKSRLFCNSKQPWWQNQDMEIDAFLWNNIWIPLSWTFKNVTGMNHHESRSEGSSERFRSWGNVYIMKLMYNSGSSALHGSLTCFRHAFTMQITSEDFTLCPQEPFGWVVLPEQTQVGHDREYSQHESNLHW